MILIGHNSHALAHDRREPARFAASRAALAGDTRFAATVFVEGGGGHGAGVLLSGGLVLTVAHVVEQGPVRIGFADGDMEWGRIVWRDDALDLVMLETTPPPGTQPARLRCAPPPANSPLTVIGHPYEERWIARNGRYRTDEIDAPAPMIAIGADLGLGHSGGPAFDPNGRVIGVATAILVSPDALAARRNRRLDGAPMWGEGLVLPASIICRVLPPNLR